MLFEWKDNWDLENSLKDFVLCPRSSFPKRVTSGFTYGARVYFETQV